MTSSAGRRVWFSDPGEPTSWAGFWIDYRMLRSWRRHPVLTFKWWRATKGDNK